MDTNLNTKPLVSINMCTFNRANFIVQAVQSILDQTYQNWELIIIDDCSTDNTQDVLKDNFSDSRIKIFKNNQNLGINKSRNKALDLSSGKYIAVLDSDDYWIDKNKIQDQVDFLESNPDHAVVGTFSEIINEKNTKIGLIKSETENEKIKNSFLLTNQIVHSSSLILKSALKEINGYNENIFIWEDYDIFLKIGRQHKIANLNKIYTAYRKHTNNISKTKWLKGRITLTKLIIQNRKYYPNFLPAIVKMFFRYLKFS